MELNATTRATIGKRVRTLRRDGLIPAEVYGRGIENRHVAVSAKQFARVYREAGAHSIVTVVIDAGEKIPTVIADVAHDHLSGTVTAIDFHRVRMDEKIQAKIPVHFIGVAPAQKAGFPIVRTLEEIEVEALPAKLPHSFEVDLSGLSEPGQSIYVRDIAFSKDVKVLTAPGAVLITIGERTKEEIPIAPPPAVAAPQAGVESGSEVAATEAPEKATESKG
ncbi:MAG: 50S ribosomal protein L25 [Patescibacteria group bacterium]